MVTVNPGGTGRPMRVISARFAPLPPSRSAIAARPSAKSYTYRIAAPFVGAACCAGLEYV